MVVLASVPFACAACSGSPKAAPSATPAHPTISQVLPPLLQCFIDHQLIPEAALQSGKNASPPDDSSTWVIDGKVTDNTRLGDWFSENSDIVVKGKAIADWTTAIEANPKTWPTSICGAEPAFS